MLRSGLAGLLLTVVVTSGYGHAQESKEAPAIGRRQSVGFFGEYSNDSSHILLGTAEQRKLLNFGASYSFRFLATRYADLQYYAEVQPAILESDPLTKEVLTLKSASGTTVSHFNYAQETACHAQSDAFSGKDPNGKPYSGTVSITCGRQWTFGQGMSPVGLHFNFMPHHRLQPVFTGLGGYMFSTQPIPLADAGSFNFTFEFGAGLEFYRSKARSGSFRGNRSIRAEYRYHHISNHDTAAENPGIDNGMLQVTYLFGR